MNRARNNAPSKCFAGLSAALAVASASAGVVLDAPGHVALEGAAVAAQGGEPGAAWRLVDWRGRDTGVSGAFDEAGKAVLPPLPAGYYRLAGGSQIPNSKSQHSGCLATLAVVSPSCRNPPCGVAGSPRRGAEGGSFFGADCGISELWREFVCPWNGGDAARTVADLAALAGFSHVRERMRWSAMQPSPDSPPDVSRHAANAALFRDRGIGVSDIFIGTPKWASPLRRLPGDLAALCRSCRDMAAAFGDTVEDWEFWNEPDIHFAPEPVWDFAAAQKAAYLGFKAARPGMPVTLAGLCQPPDGLYLKTLLANGVAPYFDVFNYHTYAPVSQYPAFFASMRKTLAEAGAGDRPVWITESGTNLEGPAALDGVRAGFKAHSPAQELVVAEFAPKSQIAMQMQGVARDYFFILGAYSERDGAKDWGILRRDGTAKPVYAALATVAREVGNARLLGALDTPAGLRAYLYEHADGSQTVAFWAESPIDTAKAGHAVVDAEPDFAREWVLNPPASAGGEAGVLHPPASAGGQVRLVDMCGAVSELRPLSDGSLLLPATRFPAYVSGLRGLRAEKAPVQWRGEAETSGPEPASPIVFRVDLAPGDFDISNRKTLAIAKGDAPRLTVQVWNLSDTFATGVVSAAGAVLDGLPGGSVEIGPMGCAKFDCVLNPDMLNHPGAASTLVLSGDFDGRPASPLAMPVLFERVFLASCEETPLDWKNPDAWIRNDSASTYSVRWDEEEQALRFDVAWDDPRVGRWFYPVLPLPPEGPNLAGTVRATFEVKTAQDKVENDFGECCLMLVRGEKGGAPGEWLGYSPPTGSWERRYVELSACPDLGEVDAIRLGANPRGMRLTFWVRNIGVLTPSENAAPGAYSTTQRATPPATRRGSPLRNF